MADETTMTDEQLDAVLEETYTQEDGSTGYVGEEESNEDNGNQVDVSPSDGVDNGQSEEEEEVTHVDETSESNEDPEDISSTEDDDSGEELETNQETDDESAVLENDEGESEATEESDEHYAFQPLRADGKEYPIESMEELYALASKGINADRKWNESSEGRKIASTLSNNDLSMDDINMLVDLKKGNLNAIQSLLKKAGVDPLDIDADALDGSYKPEDHSTGDMELRLNDVISRTKNKPRYQETVNVIMEQWDKGSKSKFYENPEMLEALNVDMQPDESGVSLYDRVSPVAEKLKAMETGHIKSDLEYYMLAGQKVVSTLNQSKASKEEAETKKKATADKKKANISKKKKTATSSRGTASKSKEVNVQDMSDEELDKLLEETN